MFKKIEDLSKPTLLSKSAIKDLRQGALELFPLFEEIAEDIIPKKGNLSSCKLRSEYKMEIIANDSDILFFTRENLIIPHLRLLHQYPDLLPRMQVDRGGLKYLYEGAPVMCPGLTSPGGIIAKNVPVGEIVGIYIEGKTHAIAIGISQMSSEDVLKEKKGLAIQTVHHIGDALWQMHDFKKK